MILLFGAIKAYKLSKAHIYRSNMTISKEDYKTYPFEGMLVKKKL